MKTQVKIAIDGNEANVTNRVGSNVYAYQILTELEKITREPVNGRDVQISVLLSDEPVSDLPQPRPGWQYRVITPKKLWTQWALPLHLFAHKAEYDVFYTPGHYAPRLSAVPYVSSVMDVGYLEFPEQFKKNDWLQLTHWTDYSVARAAKVIAISEATKADVVKRYHKAQTEVVVAYPSVTTPTTELTSLKKASLLKKLGVHKPYLVYVGTLQPRKNIIKLVEAFERVKRSLASQKLSARSKKRHHPWEKLQLVIAGKIGWLADATIQRIKESPFFSDILITGYVSDETKSVLLQGAEASVLVGLYEGFGIPPLESMHVGTIPIVSTTTSLPEVVGEAGILVDPHDAHAIAEGIKRALSLTAKDKAKFRRHMRSQVKKFSWHHSASTILHTLLEVVDSRKK